MKGVLFVSTLEHIPYGGSELLWYQAAKELFEKKDIRVGVYVKYWKKKAKHIQELEALGVTIFEHKQKTIWKAGIDSITKRIFNADFIKKHFSKILANFQPTLVVISTVNNLDTPALNYMKQLEHIGIKYAILVQLADHFFWKTDSKLLLFSRLYQKAQKMFFVSEVNWRLTERQIAARLNNGKVVNNPYNGAGKLVAYPKIEKGSYYKIAVVARLLCIHKGQDILFEVLRQDKWKARNLKVTLYGEGENEQSLKQLKDLYELDHVHFGAYHNNIDDLWSNHHVLLLPSRMEGLSLAMIEAMMCGRTVICTDVGGAKEIVTDNETGFIAEAATVRHLDEAMERAWTKRAEWKEMGVRARNHVQKVLPKDVSKTFATELLKLL